MWRKLTGGTVEKAKEKVLDKIPDHIEERDKQTLRKIEGLLHLLWFKPPATQMPAIESLHDELSSEPTPTEIQKTLVPYLGELAYALTDITEKAKYLKWKSVLDKKEFSKSDAFKGLDLNAMAKEAFVVALEDILKQHPLAYIGYPERATMKDKVLRVLLNSLILPIRLASSFKNWVTRLVKRILPWLFEKEEEDDSPVEDAEIPKNEE
jgi:hypothetical protein